MWLKLKSKSLGMKSQASSVISMIARWACLRVVKNKKVCIFAAVVLGAIASGLSNTTDQFANLKTYMF